MRRSVILATAVLGSLALTTQLPASAAGQEAAPGTIMTIAGGVGGQAKATKVALFEPCAVTTAGGFSYVSDFSGGNFELNLEPGLDAVIRQLSSRTGRLTATPVGRAGVGDIVSGGSAGGGQTGQICGVAVDHRGDLIFTEREPSAVFPTFADINRVWFVPAHGGRYFGRPMLRGDVYAIAGQGEPAFSGDGAQAQFASVSAPTGVAVDAAGNVVFADTGNDRVRVIAARTGTFYGVAMKANDIYTVAGNGVHGDSGDGGLARLAELELGTGVRIDGSGNLLVTDSHVVRVVPTASGRYYGRAMKAGKIYTIIGTPGVRSCADSGNGGTWRQARLCADGIAMDRVGNIVIAGRDAVWVAAVRSGRFYGEAMRAGRIYKVALPSAVRVVSAVSVDGAGNAVLVDPGSPAPAGGALYLLASRGGRDFGLRVSAGHFYHVGGNGSLTFAGDGGPATSAQLGGASPFVSVPSQGIAGVAVDSHGNIAIADKDNHRVRVVAKSTGTFYGKRMASGDIYTIAANVAPNGIAADRAGDLAVSGPLGGKGALWLDAGSTGQRFGRHLVAGHEYVLMGCPASQFRFCFQPPSPAFDANGNLVVSFRFINRNSDQLGDVRVIAARNGTFYGRRMVAGHQYVLFDGTIGGPVAVDPHGNIVFGNRLLQNVFVWPATTGTFYGRSMTARQVTQIGAEGTDSDPFRWGLTVDPAGNVLYADPIGNRVRAIAGASGTFYGVAMSVGGIYTIAGTGAQGWTGDGKSALRARLASPDAVASTAAGDLIVADLLRVRIISG